MALCAASTQIYDDFGNIIQTTTYSDYGYQTQDRNTPNYDLKDVPPVQVATTNVTYDSAYHLYPISVTNAAGQTTSFEIYGFNGVLLNGFQRQPGLLKSVTDPNGVTTKYEYDPFGRLHAVYDGYSFAGFGDTDPWNGDPVTRYRYWDNRFNHSVTFLDPANDRPFIAGAVQRPGSWPYPADSSSGYSYVSQTMYDGFGRPIQERQIYASVAGYSQTREIFTTTEYDAQGQVACQTAPFDVPFYYDRGETWPNGVFYNAPCSSKPHTATTYDALGRVRFVTGPDGRQTEHRYSINNNLGPMRLHHNVINPNRQRMRFSYDSLNQLAQVTEFTGNCGSYWGYNCGAGDTTWGEYAAAQYEYDVSGNLTKVTDAANNVTTMGYDGFGRKTSMSDPDMGAWQYEYDPAGSLTRQTDANGGILCFEYDGLNRLTRKGEGNTAVPCAITDELAAYQYDTAQNGVGQLAQVTWPGGGDTFFYDSLGRMYKQTRQIDNRAYTMETLSYDALHRPLQIRYPNGEVVTMTYDREGENSLKAGNDWLVNDVRYNGQGQIKYLDRGAVPNTNPDTWYTYYPASGNFRLQRIQHGSLNSDNRPDFSYEYDSVGNITKVTAVTASYGTDSQTFTYDHLNRLKTASAAGTAAYSHTYAYDTIGSMISRTEGGVTYTYSYGAQPHAVTGVAVSGGQPFSFTYDANGNMKTRNDADGNFAQAWDAENRLTLVTETGSGAATTFFYDPDGNRVKTIRPDGSILYTPFPDYEEERGQPPTVTLLADGQGGSLDVWPNASFTLSWSSSGADSCRVNGIWDGAGGGGRPLQGQETMPGFASGRRTYTITCANRYGESSVSVTVRLKPPPTLDFYSQPASITPFQSFTLRWNSSGASSCVASGAWRGRKPVNGSRRMPGFRTGAQTYRLRCSNPAGSVTRSVTVAAQNGGGGRCRPRQICLPQPPPRRLWQIPGKPVAGKGGAVEAAQTVTYTITRITYRLAGQPVAVRVTGDPDPANNGLFYIHSDHLGSASVLTKYGDGYIRSDSLARYTPFGSWRTEPTAGLTDRGFTGHKSNNLGGGANDLGLIYMNARYFLPGTGRFLSADTIVPNPQNPQSLNRYSYVYNNTLNLVDPFGHCGADLDSDGGVNIQAEIDCNTIRWELEDQYDIKITGVWLLSEMELFRDGLQTILDIFQSEGISNPIKAFKTTWAGVKFKRVRKHSSARAWTRTKNRIDLHNGAFLDTVVYADGTVEYVPRAADGVYGTIAHELAHVWDRQEGYTLSEDLKGETGGRGEFCFFTFCLGTYQVNDTPYKAINPFNSREDWAYTFQAFVVDQNGLSALNPNDDVRIPFVSQQIQRLEE